MTATQSGKVPVVTADSSSRYVQVGAFRIHYHDTGTSAGTSGGAGAGPPVVLLHGSGPGATGWSNFSPNIGPLSRTFRVLAVDMPGWGDSDTPTAETGNDHAQVLIDLLDELGIAKAALVGNSMGGMTAITAAIRFPGRVSHLITMGAPCPGVGLFTPGGMSEGLKILIRCYQEPTPANFKQLVQIMCFDAAMATDELAAQRATAANAHPEHLKSFLASMADPNSSGATFFGLAPQIPQIGAPTMAVHGRDDRVVHYENSLRLTAAIPDSRLVLFNRCGHWAQLEHAAEFNALLTHFVQSD